MEGKGYVPFQVASRRIGEKDFVSVIQGAEKNVQYRIVIDWLETIMMIVGLMLECLP